MPIAVRDVTWTEDQKSVRVVVPLKGVKANKVDIFSTNSYLKVHYPPFLFEANLHADVDDERSHALIGNGRVTFTLEKREHVLWGKLRKGDRDDEEGEVVLDKKEARGLREKAVQVSHERAKKDEQAKAERKEEERKQAVKEQMRIDDEERQRVANVKEEARREASQSLENWKEVLKERKNKVALEVEKKTETNSSSAGQTRWRKKKDIFDTAPPSRQGGTITVSFTPRAFSTPSRESKANEEEEWLKKMAEAAKVKAEQDKDLGDVEERDPLWLKDKGNDFYRHGNFLAAINAYSHSVRRGGGMPMLFSNRAACYLHLERYQECIKDCTMALDLLHPPVEANLRSRLRAHVRRGTAYLRLELYAEALQDYLAALKLDPQNSELQEDSAKIRSIVQGWTITT